MKVNLFTTIIISLTVYYDATTKCKICSAIKSEYGALEIWCCNQRYNNSHNAIRECM